MGERDGNYIITLLYKTRERFTEKQPITSLSMSLNYGNTEITVVWNLANELVKWRCITEQQMPTVRGHIQFFLLFFECVHTHARTPTNYSTNWAFHEFFSVIQIRLQLCLVHWLTYAPMTNYSYLFRIKTHHKIKVRVSKKEKNISYTQVKKAWWVDYGWWTYQWPNRLDEWANEKKD